ncbi:YqiJ family protein [Desulfoluna butyratoxydans]|uniref:Uncharacterized protein n=1 Tax=Desulfoluna butyratoxydans TaxID=231438 RepID=A0A4U8YIG6_9BACT|nr:YqiJ family protein [Desulfoluna butyratoxydans]VFQ42729.1 protein of unknown function duf1449 [Desulfoluna butyratoxydans]
MVKLILHPANLPFTVALGVMLCISVMEGVGTLLGFGISDLIDSLFPDVDATVDIDAPDVAESGLTRFLGWLQIRGVPFLILLVVSLTSFGLLGLGIQSAAETLTGGYLPSALAAVGALLMTLPVVKVFGRTCARFLPRDETEVISEKSYIGKVARITLGRAEVSSPAQAKLKDRYGTTHYIMVEPDEESQVLEQGDAVLIVEQKGAVFRAILNTCEELED